MHADRNTTSVIFHRTGAICLKGHPYFITGTCQMLIHGIVDNLINQVVESFGRCTSDIHSRTFPDRFKPLQYRYDASSISVLEGLEAVRKRPGMYIGSTTTKGLNHLIYEIVDNSVDEHLAGACDKIWVTLEADGSCTVEDNGRGIPVGMHAKGVSAARVVFSTLHAGGKFDNNAYKTSGGLHGVGSSVVNALSTYMDVEISQGGYVYHDRYAQGHPVVELEDGLLPKIGKTKKTGTKINFLPDPEIFEKTRFREDDVKSRMHETAYLNPKLTIIYEDRRKPEAEHIEFLTLR